MLRFLTILFLIKIGLIPTGSLQADDKNSAQQAQAALDPMITLQISWQNGDAWAMRYELADWILEPLNEAQWELLIQRQGRYAELARRRGYANLIQQFIENGFYWHLARFGLWVRLSNKAINTFYYIPYHRSARDALAFLNTPENKNARIDIYWDPLRTQTDARMGVSSLLTRMELQDVLASIQNDEEDILQLVYRLGAQIDEKFSEESLAEFEPELLESHCSRFTREIGLVVNNK